MSESKCLSGIKIDKKAKTRAAKVLVRLISKMTVEQVKKLKLEGKKS